MLFRSLEFLALAGIPATLILAWRRPPEDAGRSPVVTAILLLFAVGAAAVTLFGIAVAVESARQDRRDPHAEFAGLGTAIGAFIGVAGGVLLLTFIAALIIRATRP